MIDFRMHPRAVERKEKFKFVSSLDENTNFVGDDRAAIFKQRVQYGIVKAYLAAFIELPCDMRIVCEMDGGHGSVEGTAISHERRSAPAIQDALSELSAHIEHFARRFPESSISFVYRQTVVGTDKELIS